MNGTPKRVRTAKIEPLTDFIFHSVSPFWRFLISSYLLQFLLGQLGKLNIFTAVTRRGIENPQWVLPCQWQLSCCITGTESEGNLPNGDIVINTWTIPNQKIKHTAISSLMYNWSWVLSNHIDYYLQKRQTAHFECLVTFPVFAFIVFPSQSVFASLLVFS